VTYELEDFAGIDIVCDWAWNLKEHQIVVKSKHFGPHVESYTIDGKKHRFRREAYFIWIKKKKNSVY
jgi:hypothetical protein